LFKLFTELIFCERADEKLFLDSAKIVVILNCVCMILTSDGAYVSAVLGSKYCLFVCLSSTRVPCGKFSDDILKGNPFIFLTPTAVGGGGCLLLPMSAKSDSPASKTPTSTYFGLRPQPLEQAKKFNYH